LAAVSSGDEAEEFNGFEDDGEEFEGFSSSPVTNGNPIETVTTSDTDTPPSEGDTSTDRPKSTPEDKPSKKKKAKKNQATLADTALEENTFSALEDVQDEADDTDVSAWMSLDLSPQMISSIARLKFSNPTPIQSAAIPEAISGRDVIGKASTGSGKTLAFAIPIVERWLELGETTAASLDGKIPIALILSPTRELAHQLTKHIGALCDGLPTGPYVCSVTGGLSVYKQQRQLAKADIVIATPGRLWEVISSSTPLLRAFKKIRFLVVDEADRLLSEGHFKEAEEILEALDRKETREDSEDSEHSSTPRQTLVFSATFNKGLQQKLAGKGKYDLLSTEQSMEYLLKRLNFRDDIPKFIDVSPVSQMAEGLKEGLIECGNMEKVKSYSSPDPSRRRQTHTHTNLRTVLGPVPLRAFAHEPHSTNSSLHQLYQRGPQTDSNASKSKAGRKCFAFADATKGTTPFRRALYRFEAKHHVDTHCHRRRRSRSRYSRR
jgi:ATP-dependent RNA helicase DDX24/MAK5